jgi:hypothetical protein
LMVSSARLGSKTQSKILYSKVFVHSLDMSRSDVMWQLFQIPAHALKLHLRSCIV